MFELLLIVFGLAIITNIIYLENVHTQKTENYDPYKFYPLAPTRATYCYPPKWVPYPESL